jgi:hypothetical protein
MSLSDNDIGRIIPSIEGNIGSPGKVNISEIGSVLSQAGAALDMVRNSSFGSNLTNIAYIYNTSDSGAFGVFDPNIDRSVKVKIVEEELKKRGFGVRYEQGSLYAWSEDMNPDQVRDEMDKMYNDLDLKGGLVIGINAAKIMEIARKNFEDLSKQVQAGQFHPLDKSDFDLLVALHLGSTIVHESVHALGAKDEATPIAAQKKWTNEKISEINSQRQSQGKVPFEMGSDIYNASTKGWLYRAAQIVPFLEAVLPEAILQYFQKFDEIHNPVDKEPNDSIETILAKNEHNPVPSGFSINKGLSSDHSSDDLKKLTLQELLENSRPRPIIRPVRRTAGINSNIGGVNIGGPFIAIDEAIPRMLSGRDITDKIDYKEGEEPYWQTRYRPENVEYKTDRFGRLTYEYDTRFEMVDYNCNNPMTWSSLYAEDNVTGPWRKVASESSDISDDVKNKMLQSLRKIGFYKFEVKSGKRSAVRMYCASYMSDAVIRACGDMKVFTFPTDGHVAIWIAAPHVEKEQIVELEKAVESGDSDRIDGFMGTSARIAEKLSFIMTTAKSICMEHGISGVYAVGGLPRTMVGSGDFREVNDIDFTASHPTECLKLGGLLAEELSSNDMGVFLRTFTMSFSYEGMKMDFRGNYVPVDVRDLMRKNGIKVTPLNYDVYARDFTANSLLYDFMSNQIYDITELGIRDVRSKTVRTIFAPEEVIPRNPLIITRAIIMMLRGWTLVPELYDAISEKSQELASGNISPLRLAYEYEKISRYSDGEAMLKEFRLSWLKETWNRAKQENPQLFEEE